MKYAFAFAVIGLGLTLSGVVNPPVRLPLFWAAASFVWVSLGYAWIGPSALGKRPGDGGIPLPFKVGLLPFFFLTWSAWHLYRVLNKEPARDVISDHLVVGRRLLRSEISGESFDHYVDLTAEFEDPRSIRSDPAYRCFPILDAGVPDIEDLRRMLQIVGGGKVFVHCAQGHGRTGLFAVALLVDRGEVSSIQEGIDLLRRSRPRLDLNRRQRAFLGRHFGHAQPGA